MALLKISKFKSWDQDDILQTIELNKLQKKRWTKLAAMRDQWQFIQHSQSKSKTFLGLTDVFALNHFFLNELEIDIISLYDKRTTATKARKAQVKQIIACLSRGMSQRETEAETGIRQSIISGIVKEIRMLLTKDRERTAC